MVSQSDLSVMRRVNTPKPAGTILAPVGVLPWLEPRLGFSPAIGNDGLK